MPSSQQNADLLEKMKEAGMLTEKTQAADAAPTPSAPVYPNEPNPRLRTPMPAQTVFGPDVQRQFLNPAIPQVRMLPQTAAANPTVGAASASQATVAIASSTSSTTTTDTDLIGINKQSGTAYTVAPGDLDTIISLSNNAGGTVTLPVLTTSNGGIFYQISAQSSGTSTTPISMTNKAGSLIVISVEMATAASTHPSATDTNGNMYFYIDGAVMSAGGGAFHALYAYNVVGGANVITVTGIAATSIVAQAAEYTTMPSFVPLDKHGASAISSAALTTPTVVTGFANGLAISMFRIGSGGQTPTGGGGWTQRFSAATWLWEDQIVPTVGTSVTGTSVTGTNPTLAVAIIATFATGTSSAGSLFPKGWFTYIENTGTGTFNLTASAGLTIDGSSSPLAIASNTGLLLIFDGANWLTERGLGGSGGGGGGTWNVTTTKTSIYTAVAGDMVIVDTSGGGFAVTIPLAASNANKSIRVKKISSDINSVTPTASGSDLIDGQATQPFAGQETDLEITSDGVSNWWIV